jgi:hypothetical protein
MSTLVFTLFTLRKRGKGARIGSEDQMQSAARPLKHNSSALTSALLPRLTGQRRYPRRLRGNTIRRSL